MNAQMATQSALTTQTIERFNDAVNRHDLGAVMNAMTEDAVFESTQPPDGDRHEGEDIRSFFERLFAGARERHFEVEECIPCGDRATVRWLHRWVGHDGTAGHVRGVDVFRVRDGKVAEKLSYVKG